MNLIKMKTKDGWITLYKALFKSFLSKNQNLADLTDKKAAQKNLGVTGDINTHNHDSIYMPIIQAKYDDLNNKIKQLNDKIDDQKHNFFTTITCNLSDFSIKPDGWYLWKGLISGVTGTWLIRKAGAKSASSYIAYSIEDPRVVISSNDLQNWYSPYGYWHA